jgi:transposase
MCSGQARTVPNSPGTGINERRRPGPLPRQRTDFLLLLPDRVRVVIECDGKHYADDDGRASPRRYADPRRALTAEFRAEIVELCQRGDRRVGQVAKDFDLTETAVRAWVKQAEIDTGTRTDGLTSDERSELARLRQENRRLREDVDILKRATLSSTGQCNIFDDQRGGGAGSIFSILVPHGGIYQAPQRRRAGCLTLADREEISRGLAAGESYRSIVRRLGRRPKRCLLAQRPRLQDLVEERLRLEWSPEQISGWLTKQDPADLQTRVSHETIYKIPVHPVSWGARQGTAEAAEVETADPTQRPQHGQGPVAIADHRRRAHRAAARGDRDAGERRPLGR